MPFLVQILSKICSILWMLDSLELGSFLGSVAVIGTGTPWLAWSAPALEMAASEPLGPPLGLWTGLPANWGPAFWPFEERDQESLTPNPPDPPSLPFLVNMDAARIEALSSPLLVLAPPLPKPCMAWPLEPSFP